MKLNVILALFLLITSHSIFADTAEIYSHSFRDAIKGVDVVAYFDLEPGEKAVKGSKKFTHKWKGATWRFSSEKNRQKFITTPEQYVPQYGGYCAFAMAKGFTASPRPNSWVIIDGKLYLNNNKSSLKLWNQSREEYITKADKNWPKLLEKNKKS